MDRAPAVRRVGGAEGRLVERVLRLSGRVGLVIARRRPKAPSLDLRRVAEVAVERVVLLTADDRFGSATRAGVCGVQLQTMSSTAIRQVPPRRLHPICADSLYASTRRCRSSLLLA